MRTLYLDNYKMGGWSAAPTLYMLPRKAMLKDDVLTLKKSQAAATREIKVDKEYVPDFFDVTVNYNEEGNWYGYDLGDVSSWNEELITSEYRYVDQESVILIPVDVTIAFEKLLEAETYEEYLDAFADHSDRFLIGLNKVLENESEVLQLDMVMQTVPDFERIGDYATNMVELAQKLKEDNSSFSESAQKELHLITAAVNEILDITVKAFANDDNEAAKSIEPLEETIDDMVMILKDRHTKRLKNGVCSISTGLVFMESLTYFERAADQCSSIAVMMLARSNKAILHNHYDYLREIHAGNDAAYNAEKNRRREQYIKPLEQITF